MPAAARFRKVDGAMCKKRAASSRLMVDSVRENSSVIWTRSPNYSNWHAR